MVRNGITPPISASFSHCLLSSSAIFVNLKPTGAASFTHPASHHQQPTSIIHPRSLLLCSAGHLLHIHTYIFAMTEYASSANVTHENDLPATFESVDSYSNVPPDMRDYYYFAVLLSNLNHATTMEFSRSLFQTLSGFLHASPRHQTQASASQRWSKPVQRRAKHARARCSRAAFVRIQVGFARLCTGFDRL
ncbi:hypothetical protein KSP39_PZI007024 [Platanthera zijinensis]|uniref:Uncharacterized protein n=1 Tax=Platanthera zijinensis TaxID=2320716 RepID=A0AAP0G9H5_9ASPA